MAKQLTSVFVIWDTQGKKLWHNRAGNKIGWVSAGAAKNAFNLSIPYDSSWNKPKFDDQQRYVVKELTSAWLAVMMRDI